jgi:GTP-binding protein
MREIDGVKHEPSSEVIVDVPTSTSAWSPQHIGHRRGQMVKMSGPRLRPVAHGVPGPGPRPDRLPLAVPHRDPRHRPAQHDVRRLGAAGGLRSRAAPTARWSPTAPGPPRPTRSSVCSPAASSSSARASMVYEGMIVGEHNRENDLDVNVAREKKLTNVRSTAADENVVLAAADPGDARERRSSSSTADEIVEVTPNAIRLRKRILDGNQAPPARRPARGMSDPATHRARLPRDGHDALRQ